MAHERRSEVLRDTCALTLSDEPLAGGVEDGAMQLPVHGPEVGIALHDLVHAEAGKSLPDLAERYPAGSPAAHAVAPPAQLPWTSADAPRWA